MVALEKFISCFILIGISLIVGCSDTTEYDHDDVAAIVRGEEITVGDIRFFSEVEDEEIPNVIQSKIKDTLIIQEAKKMGIEVSKDDIEGTCRTFCSLSIRR
ncbi:hypothetical protein [Tenuibacillus multivorans]|uniref:hypothetical protein n=1 Tax=Tenuibacillus multivorans TaxID=237069 RepID=UPI000A85BC78|nr:hypothetical protein [Tenuibacillus multivorans]GEL77417.1 hypothetical protein TMU01_16520 [Tenuibacillus multivorans]